MTVGYGSIYNGEPQPDLITIDFSSSPIIGNDDATYAANEDDNPYAASSDPVLGHIVGELTLSR